MPFGFDHMVLVWMSLCGFVGFFAGLIRSLVGIGGLLIGLAGAIAAPYSGDILELAKAQTGSSNEMYNKTVVMVVAFFGLQLLAVFAGWISTLGIYKTLSYGDRLHGGVVGAAHGFFAFVAFFLVNAVGYAYWGYGSPQAPPGSISYPAVRAAGQVILNAAVPFLPADIAAAASAVKL